MPEGKPRVFVAPGGKLQAQLFPARVRDALEKFSEPIYCDREERLSSGELAARISGCQGIITGWGSPRLTPEVLDVAQQLRIIAHAAGSVRPLLPDPPDALFERGIKITCATQTMSRYVAELTLCLAVASLRRLSRFREEMKGSGLWWGTYSALEPETLIGQRVGLVGLGMISWEFIRLLQPFACEIWAYSRHADPQRAGAEGVKLVALDDLLRNCRVICLLAAVRPDTVKMIGREQLSLVQDGSVIVNTARGALIDEEALIDELRSGRLWAGLDVTDPEPPPADSPLRTLPNVLLSPHVGGPVPSRYWEMAMFAVEELQRFFGGEPLRGEVTKERLEGMA
jgi:phosphoglycerate dehydrogenase-like enzyme